MRKIEILILIGLTMTRTRFRTFEDSALEEILSQGPATTIILGAARDESHGSSTAFCATRIAGDLVIGSLEYASRNASVAHQRLAADVLEEADKGGSIRIIVMGIPAQRTRMMALFTGARLKEFRALSPVLKGRRIDVMAANLPAGYHRAVLAKMNALEGAGECPAPEPEAALVSEGAEENSAGIPGYHRLAAAQMLAAENTETLLTPESEIAPVSEGAGDAEIAMPDVETSATVHRVRMPEIEDIDTAPVAPVHADPAEQPKAKPDHLEGLKFFFSWPFPGVITWGLMAIALLALILS